VSYLVLARKWRPQTFDDLVGQEPIARILKNAISTNKVAHAYIFSGPRGVGKTSTARILAKALNCSNGPTPEPCGKCPSCTAISEGSSMDVLEIDGASNTGVDNIRDLRERVRYAPSENRYKVYIIDEAHMLSTSAFNALLKTLEEPPPHVIFVLATTDPKKIPATVMSRCQHLPFRRISGQEIRERLKLICSAEGLNIEEPALEMIARAADGSMRDSLTILDQTVSFSDNITTSDIKDLLGITDINSISQLASSLVDGNRKDIITTIAELTDSGTDLKIFTKDFLQFIRNLLIVKIAGGEENIIDLGEEELDAINLIKDRVSEEHLSVILSELIKAEPGIRSAFHTRVAFEMTLIRLSMLCHLKSVNEALRIVSSQQLAISSQENRSQKIENKVKETGNRGIGEQGAKITDSPIHPFTHSPIQDIWNAAIEKIDSENHPLACKLKEGSLSFGSDEIRITFNGGLSIHVESVKDNLPGIKKIIKDLSGKNIDIIVDTKKVKSLSKKDFKEKALQNPLVKEALELFEGRIVDVTPIKNMGGNNV
jgi:DNA polymerase-3 subunit gamma/tau